MTPPTKRRLRTLARPIARTRIGQSLRSRVSGPSDRLTIPFGSIALPSTGDGSIPIEVSASVTTRFILLGEGRSGSSLLREELDRRWTEIRAKGELFSLKERDEATSFEDVAFSAFSAEAGESIVGFKLFSTHATERQLSDLLRLEEMRVIILRRRNPLRRHVSDQIARRTGRWSEGRSKTPTAAIPLQDRRITVDVKNFESELRISEDRYREFDRLTFRVPKVGIWYEDMVADLDRELRRMATFLGAAEPAHESPPRMKRQNPEPLKDLIANYDEVTRFLRRIGRSEYLLEDQSGSDRTEETANTGDARPQSAQ